jgi:hypothetical protein
VINSSLTRVGVCLPGVWRELRVQAHAIWAYIYSPSAFSGNMCPSFVFASWVALHCSSAGCSQTGPPWMSVRTGHVVRAQSGCGETSFAPSPATTIWHGLCPCMTPPTTGWLRRRRWVPLWSGVWGVCVWCECTTSSSFYRREAAPGRSHARAGRGGI